MAQLEIPRADAEAGTLPPVCIKCGADAEWCSRRVIRAVRIDAADIVLSPVAPEVVERSQSHVGDDARFGRRGL